jgi:hypothetical protein
VAPAQLLLPQEAMALTRFLVQLHQQVVAVVAEEPDLDRPDQTAVLAVVVVTAAA